jgi:hypothetical protein
MAIIQESQIAALRETERDRFQRWFVETPFGMAYIDRAGRPRRISDDEFTVWRAAAHARIEEMLADLPRNTWIALGAMVGIAIFAPMLFSALGIEGLARKLGIAAAFVLIEGGLLGLEAHGYFARWRQQRATLEAAMAGRAPLAIDPAKARIPRNWFLLAQYWIAALVILAMYAIKVETELLRWVDWNLLILLVPIAWALHFASKRHDRIARERLRGG